MSTKTRELAKTYRPADVEPDVLERWLAAKAYHASPSDPGEPYAIVIPPPNVTAALHLGHALNNTLQDVLIRYHRMLGRNTVWMPGTDHAGIATQTVVEKRVFQEEGKRRVDFERDTFVQKIQAWKDEYEAFITDQLKRMGCSCDWDRQRFTMDPVCARAVREAFFRLFKDGLIYRGKRLVNWDPATQTALADDEVEMQEIDGNFYYMKYPLVEESHQATSHQATKGEASANPPLDGSVAGSLGGSAAFVTVATTRPETMLGDTAVAVNPKDPERAHLIGRHVRLPIVNRIVPIVGDDYVVLPDPKSDDAKAQFASGFLKVTPAHDPNDYEIGQRHSLPVLNVMAPDASISTKHGWPEDDAARADAFLQQLEGKDRYEARKMIVAWFKERDLLAEVRPYRHSVGHSYRSHVAIEPYLSDQWYVAVRKQIGRLPAGETVPGTDLPANSLAGLALRAMADDQRTLANAPAPSNGADAATEPTIGQETAQRRDPIHNLRVGEKTWEGHLRFYPDRYAKSFQTWHENIRDWCISRQLWWGHRIPVWSGESGQVAEWPSDRVAVQEVDGRVYVCLREDDAGLIAEIEAAGFAQDPDVLDTWFSSALWPLSTMGWPNPEAFPDQFPEGEAVLAKWNPTNVLCTAREIITLWVSRMVMFNLYLSDPDLDPRSTHQRLPFYDVFIHAMIQDGHGQKMSKSLGNGVDPMDIIHSHGSDAMRFTLAQMTTHTQDVRLPVDMIDPDTDQTFTPQFITTSTGQKVAAPVQTSPSDPAKKFVSSFGAASGQAKPTPDMPLARNTSGRFDNGRNFANKLWNAVRFALTSLEAPAPGSAPGSAPSDNSKPETRNSELSLPDRWILSRLARTVQTANQALKDYEFSNYAQCLYDFFWRDLCDWYIEAVKPTARDNPAQRVVLAACIDASLRLLHPVMPFITEELWTHLNAAVPTRGLEGVTLPASDLLITADWPKVAATLIDEKIEQQFDLVQRLVSAARQVRTQHTVPPRQKVEVTAKAPPAIAQRLLEHQGLLEVLANLECREVGPRIDKPADAAVAVTGDIELYLHGLIDPDTEKTRLQKRTDDLSKTIRTLQSRLSNESYIQKAPPKLVQETQDQLAAAERELEAVHQQLSSL